MADEIICPKCHAQNPKGTVFCGKCGTSLGNEASDGEAKDPLIGSFVGDRFLVHNQLGEGGMGVVYRAEQTAIDRTVALKVLHPHVTDDTMYARFRNEAASCSRLNHPNTITIFDFGKTTTGSMYIAMEFIEGTSLDDEIADHGAIEWQRTAKIATQICGSLQDAHDNGIIHRDLKPENVMLCQRSGEQDVVKVLDFGIAKMIEDDGQDQRKALTKTGMVFGTPQYMSPEQIRGEKVDARSDIYSTGVILYQMLTGSLPFLSETPMAVLTKHLMDTPPPMSEANPAVQVPQELEALVQKTLAKDAADRPQTMKELADAIDAIMASAGPLPVGAGQSTAVLPAVVPGGATAQIPAPTPAAGSAAPTPPSGVPGTPVGLAAPEQRGGGKGMLIGIIVGGVVLLGGGGAAAWYFLMGPGSGSETAPVSVTQQFQQPVAPQPPLPQPQQPVVGAAVPAPLPAIDTDPIPAIPTEPDPGESSGSGGSSSGGKAKKRDAKCGFAGTKDPIAGAVLGNLKLSETSIKKCLPKDGTAKSVFSFVVNEGENRLKKVAKKTGGAEAACLANILNQQLRATDTKDRTGTATFALSRTKGAIDACAVNVSTKEKATKVTPIKPKDPKAEDKKKKKKKKKKNDKPKTGLVKSKKSG